MKKAFIYLFCLFATIEGFSQSSQNLDQLKAELVKYKEENASLRKSLKVGTAIKEMESDNISFKLVKFEGNSKNQTVTATVLLETSAANWYIMSQVKSIIDIDGNEYKLKSHTIGASDFSKVELTTGVPIKCTYTFGGILPEVKIIRLFRFDYTHRLGEKHFVEFRDLSVDWK